MKMKLIAVAVTSVLALSITACGDKDKKDAPASAEIKKVLSTNADIAFAAYSDSVKTAEDLKAALATLKATPDATNLNAAKDAWLTAREPYGQTEVYRFRDTPIDALDLEGDVNAWPLGESLIDYVASGNDFGDDQIGVTQHGVAAVNSGNAIDAAYANSNSADNIIGSTVAINAALLANTLQGSDEHDVITGYHAIEFMLWGQDLNTDGSADTKTTRDTSGGQRPVTDFVADATCTSGATSVAAATCTRRHQYMEVVVDKLIADLTAVKDEWAADGKYRTDFADVTTQKEANRNLLQILTGMGTLAEGELAGERMKIALLNNSQEDEHSCFSDNTHRDIWLNAEGVSNSFTGTYAGYDSTQDSIDNVTTNAVDGYGIDDYLTSLGKAALVTEVAAKLTDTQKAYAKIDTDARDNAMPFDVVIKDVADAKAANVKATIVALNAEAQAVKSIAKALGLDESLVIDPEASACDTTKGDAVDGEEC